MDLLNKILGIRKEPAAEPATTQDVIDNLRLISKGERHVAEFYRLCGDVLADEKDFWHALAASEESHAEAALKMAGLVAKEPGKYKPGKAFNAASIRMFGLHLDDLVSRMRAGKIKKNELLSLAVDIESSVVELNYGEIVETAVPEYHALSRLLEEETGEHRRAFESRMKKGEQGDKPA
jgi:hypothetical protein